MKLVKKVLTYRELFRLYNCDNDKYEKPQSVKNLFVPTDKGDLVAVSDLVKKQNHDILHVILENGIDFKCSDGHIVFCDGLPIKVKDASHLDSEHGKLKIVSKEFCKKDDVYDISIPAPHKYKTPNGIYHHNTFFALSILKNFLDSNEEGVGLIFESEGALSKDLIEERGLDSRRVIIIPVETVEQFKHQALKFIGNYLEKSEKERRPIFMLLDSLGMLSTSKEMTDTEAGKETKDMTRTQQIKGAFRVLTLKLSKAKIPLLVTNHVYQTMGMFPTKEVSGGSGLKYSASSIVALGKSKEKDSDGKMSGVKIRCKMLKGRKTREGGEIRTLLSFSQGLSKFYGLVDIAIKHNIFRKVSTKIEVCNGDKVFEKHIYKNPEKYFDEETLNKINEACKKEFFYGGMDGDVSDDDDE
jgi:RecA/RadA recombinase